MTNEMIADYPAYSIFAAKPVRNFELGVDRPAFRHGELVGLPFESARYGIQYRFFRFGSAVSYALQYNECPIKAYEETVARKEQTHWLNAEAVTITDTKGKKEVRVAVDWGDEVVFEGRLFKIEKAHNGNAKLVEV